VSDLPSPPPPDRPGVPPPPGAPPGSPPTVQGSPPAVPAIPPLAGEDPPTPSRPSRRPLVVGLLLVAALAGVVVALWVWLAAPSVCQGRDVRSDRFGYCLAAPDGWQVAEAPGQDTDQLFRADGATTVTIQAVATSADLESFASIVREGQSDDELDPGDVSALTVDGVDALMWDAQLQADRTPIRARTVVFVSGGVGWRVQLADTADAFDDHAAELDAILRSWRFL
jgi:hypothetical protein